MSARLGGRALAALLALALSACGGHESGHVHALPAAADAPVLGQVDADWAVVALDGKRTRLGDLAGDVVVVNRWATWCGPCVKEMPSLQALSDALAGEGVHVLAVSNEDPETIRRFADARGFTLPFARPAAAWPEVLSSDLIPATWILDGQGRVRLEHIGFRDWNAPEVRAFLRGLLDAS